MPDVLIQPAPLAISTPSTQPIADPQTAAAVEAAVQWLNRAVQASGVRLAIEVSEYILTTFFGGDYAAFADHDRTKPQSFAALLRRPDLALAEATLYRLVRIGHQAQLLPAAVAEALSPTHHRVLLAVRDLRHKGRLAREAAEQGWTVQQLEAEVKKLEPSEPVRGGRPPLPAVVKAMGQVARAWQRGIDVPQFAAAYADLSLGQKGELEAQVAQLEADLAAIRKVLGESEG